MLQIAVAHISMLEGLSRWYCKCTAHLPHIVSTAYLRCRIDGRLALWAPYAARITYTIFWHMLLMGGRERGCRRGWTLVDVDVRVLLEQDAAYLCLKIKG